MTSIFIYPYKAGSKSTVALAQKLPAKVIKRENSNFKPSNSKIVVNWGSTRLPEEFNKCAAVFNSPNAVRESSNKLSFFQKVAAAPEERRPKIPPFTTVKDIAAEWLREGARMLFARTVLNGSSGEGIVKVTSEQELANIPEGTLIVKYIPKRREFRLHFTSVRPNQPFCTQEKKLRVTNREGQVDFHIRNLDNNFVFVRDLPDLPPVVLSEAAKAFALSGLDFGAIDVIYNEKEKQAYVLEVNTAPGLEGSTLDDYQQAIAGLARNKGVPLDGVPRGAGII